MCGLRSRWPDNCGGLNTLSLLTGRGQTQHQCQLSGHGTITASSWYRHTMDLQDLLVLHCCWHLLLRPYAKVVGCCLKTLSIRRQSCRITVHQSRRPPHRIAVGSADGKLRIYSMSVRAEGEQMSHRGGSSRTLEHCRLLKTCCIARRHERAIDDTPTDSILLYIPLHSGNNSALGWVLRQQQRCGYCASRRWRG